MSSGLKSMWIGHPGIYPKTDAERTEVEKLLRSYNCIPVFISQETFYQACLFHETVVRPLFHNFKSL